MKRTFPWPARIGSNDARQRRNRSPASSRSWKQEASLLFLRNEQCSIIFNSPDAYFHYSVDMAIHHSRGENESVRMTDGTQSFYWKDVSMFRCSMYAGDYETCNARASEHLSPAVRVPFRPPCLVFVCWSATRYALLPVVFWRPRPNSCNIFVSPSYSQRILRERDASALWSIALAAL